MTTEKQVEANKQNAFFCRAHTSEGKAIVIERGQAWHLRQDWITTETAKKTRRNTL